MPFDPDEFLKESPAVGFDPDAFLAEEKDPVVQESGVDIAERLTTNILKEPESQLEYLRSKGYQAERHNDQLKVRRPGDPEWRVVDPEGVFSLKEVALDMWEAIPDIGIGVALSGPAGKAAKAASAGGKVAGKVLGAALEEFPIVGGVIKGVKKGAKVFKEIKNEIPAAKSISERIKDVPVSKSKIKDPFKIRKSR